MVLGECLFNSELCKEKITEIFFIPNSKNENLLNTIEILTDIFKYLSKR